MNIKLETLLARISDFSGIKDPYGATHLPVYNTATFDLKKQEGDLIYDYSRTDNPTRNALEEIFTLAEKGAGAVCTNTGIAAIALLFETVLNTGDTVLVEKDCYGGTFRLLKMITEKYRVKTVFADFSDKRELLKYAEECRPKLMLCESPTNPGMKIIDISAVAEIAGKTGSRLAVDNSLATFASQNPLEMGADFSVFSATKYVSGHGSVISGAVAAKRPEDVKKLKYYLNAQGRAQSPFDSYIVSLGLATLPYRMKIQEKSALIIAKYLASRADIKSVRFPFLPGNKYFKLAKKQMRICPAVLTVDMTTGKKAENFVAKTKLFGEKASFGTADSRIEMPAKISHASYSEKELNAIGISKSTIRLSIGLEDTNDLIDDIKNALR